MQVRFHRGNCMLNGTSSFNSLKHSFSIQHVDLPTKDKYWKVCGQHILNKTYFHGVGGWVIRASLMKCNSSYLSMWCAEVLQTWTCKTWILTRQIWGIWKLRPAYSPETPNLGENRWCFVPCDLEIWWMTLENKRAPHLCCFKLCATFHSHRWIQTGVAVRKRPIWVKFNDF